MPYLVDGHNLIGKMPGLNLDDLDDERRLIEMLQDYCRRSGKDVEVYFDHASTGGARARSHGRVTARFVADHETADQAIARHLQRLGKEAANWTVVSSDNEVREAGRHSRARVISSSDFATEIASNDTRKADSQGEKLSKDEVDE